MSELDTLSCLSDTSSPFSKKSSPCFASSQSGLRHVEVISEGCPQEESSKTAWTAKPCSQEHKDLEAKLLSALPSTSDVAHWPTLLNHIVGFKIFPQLTSKHNNLTSPSVWVLP